MRAGLALIAALALCATPVVAQSKSKLPPAVQILEMCELLASGDVLAMEAANSEGWDTYEDELASPHMRTINGAKQVAGLGYAEMYTLLETYPSGVLGYCRVDITDAEGDAQAVVQSVQNLDRYEGQGQQISEGSFASLIGAYDKNRLLLVEHSVDGFILQLTILPTDGVN
ncbi:hypothetical protein [Devosia lacusdianchii]|uniref:hypothetical protein n=1 Tax=Devosia lacusdianchii TaxID=2917991 RepID=UPI001F066B53|nr:hypothetical protein [Devosia sp. JXJ CY 41]